jgi:hypothetical protein
LPNPTQSGHNIRLAALEFSKNFLVQSRSRHLSAIDQGNPTAAEQLLPLVHDELPEAGHGESRAGEARADAARRGAPARG